MGMYGFIYSLSAVASLTDEGMAEGFFASR